MELLKGIIAEDLFLYLSEYKTFIISDVHLGYEESLNRKGILIPRNNYDDLILRLEKSIEKILKTDVIKTIILNGDVIHEFGKISRREKDLAHKFIAFLSKYGKIIFIEGNHDKMLKYVLEKYVEMKDSMILDKILIIHGDKIPSMTSLKNINTIIIGHEHSAINIGMGLRTEKYKCFLKGQYNRKNLIVMPSCNLFIEGTDVLRERLLSPFLKKVNLKNFEAYVIEDKIYDFGKLKNLQNS
jgi:uncharacterized protein